MKFLFCLGLLSTPAYSLTQEQAISMVKVSAIPIMEAPGAAETQHRGFTAEIEKEAFGGLWPFPDYPFATITCSKTPLSPDDYVSIDVPYRHISNSRNASAKLPSRQRFLKIAFALCKGEQAFLNALNLSKKGH